MLKARKRNRVLRIPDEKLEEYKKMGYTITDEEGNLVFEPQDDQATIAELRRENAALKQKIAEYELIMAQKGVTAEAEQTPEAETEEAAPKKGKTAKTKAE